MKFSNEVLVQRAIVDWSIPHPVSCPETIKALLLSSTLKRVKSIICQNIDCLSVETLEREQIAMKLAKLLIELRMNSRGVHMC